MVSECIREMELTQKTTWSQKPLVNVVLFSFFWAVQIFLSKLAFLAGAKVIPFTVQSTIVAIVLLSVYMLWKKRSAFKQLTPKILVALLIANAIHNGFGGFLSNAGISMTTAINAGFLIQFSTVTTSLLAWLILKEKLTFSKAITLVIIMLGTFLLLTKGQLNSFQLGDLLILLACLSWSLGNVLVRRILKKGQVDSDLISFLRPIAGLPVLLVFVVLAPIYPATTQVIFQQNLFDWQYFGLVFLSGLFMVLLWIFLNRTLKIASASYMTMMSSLTPVLVALLAILFLQETLLPIQWLGVILIGISGIVTQVLKIEKQ